MSKKKSIPVITFGDLEINDHGEDRSGCKEYWLFCTIFCDGLDVGYMECTHSADDEPDFDFCLRRDWENKKNSCDIYYDECVGNFKESKRAITSFLLSNPNILKELGMGSAEWWKSTLILKRKKQIEKSIGDIEH